MVQVEIFNASNPEEVRTQFNDWIEQENPDIVETKVSEGAKSYTLWIFYRVQMLYEVSMVNHAQRLLKAL